ncbi:hypothetical protein LIA77_02237 [Sarocladium implicatum]|nr:hypothetical protein LIA77_02237 [Sarocladium implicatum]
MPHVEHEKGSKRPKSSKTRQAHASLQAPTSDPWSQPQWIDDYERGVVTSRRITEDEARRIPIDRWNWVQWDHDVGSYVHFTWRGREEDWHAAEPLPVRYPVHQEDTSFAGGNSPRHTYVINDPASTASAHAYGRANAKAPSTAADAIAERLNRRGLREEPIIVTLDAQDRETRARGSRGSTGSSNGQKRHGSDHSHRSHKSRESRRSREDNDGQRTQKKSHR